MKLSDNLMVLLTLQIVNVYAGSEDKADEGFVFILSTVLHFLDRMCKIFDKRCVLTTF